MRSSLALTLVTVAICIPVTAPAVEPLITAEIISVTKIGDAGKHNAFTDLVQHKDTFYCVYREATGHVSGDGVIRLLTSRDGKEWTSQGAITDKAGDLRDPKICVLPDGKLMLSTVLWTPQDPDTKHVSRAYFSGDGKTWDGPHRIGDPNYWLWRTSWHGGKAYNVGYATQGEKLVRLYRSDDGNRFTSLVDNLGVKNEQPNESALAWEKNGDALCLLRCEKPAVAQLGRAKPPYQDWKWTSLDQHFGGPNLIQHASGAWLAAGRIYKPAAHTSLCWLDLKNHKLVELVKLPSGGDTSYPGLVWHDGELWMSYYSSHEGKTSVYIARLKVSEEK